MALIQCDFFSETLGLCTSINVILPQSTVGQIGMKGSGGAGGSGGEGRYPTLYLLHGLSDDHTIWLRRTSIERYVAPLGLAVVMPAGGRSWYADMHGGLKYWTYLSQELPALCRQFFPLSDRREDNFVAGLSMGGYGAFKLALRCPDRFAAAASLSGALDMGEDMGAQVPAIRQTELRYVFGDLSKFAGSDNDTMALAQRVAQSNGPRPRLYQCCGTTDFLYQQNLRFRDHARSLGLDLTYKEHAGKGHDWGYWDQTIQDVLAWLPLRNS
ncbi:MAG: alpha/beta hydrolase family protein [Phycisphaeraceae bacterium]